MSYEKIGIAFTEYLRAKCIPGKMALITTYGIICPICEEGSYFFGCSQPDAIKCVKDEGGWKDTRKGLTCPDCIKKKSL